MSIRFPCRNPECGRSMKAPDDAAGKQARCPACGTVQPVPEPAPPADSSLPGGTEPDLAALAQVEASQPADPGQRKLVQQTPAPGPEQPKRVARPPAGRATASRTGEGLPIGTWAIGLVLIAALVAGGVWGYSQYQAYRRRQNAATDKPAGGGCGGPMDYADRVVGGLKIGQQAGSTHQLRNVHQALNLYAEAHNGRFPPSLEALTEEGLIGNDALTAPDRPGRPGEQYFYLPGQARGMSADNVLVYEEQGAYRGRRLVLRLDGRVEQMTSDELAEALSTTRERLGQ